MTPEILLQSGPQEHKCAASPFAKAPAADCRSSQWDCGDDRNTAAFRGEEAVPGMFVLELDTPS
jgi:hypothetical protein